MLKEIVFNFVSVFANVYFILIFVRILLSFLPIKSPRIRLFIFNVTEPVLAPIRKVIPPLGGVMDLSPIIFYLILEIIIEVLARML